ncbi:sulfatase [Halosquirtibacter xylanolyticus]|uniref:sulfatase family protein n=1 Tax=Halosquirtibacter xylanolyticus TaxID=3374599 RepID=UPI00374A1558|nr:sulfatase [Prolixibacteraceae bacterium]
MFKIESFTALALCSFIFGACNVKPKKEGHHREEIRKPNILFIMTDDHTTQAMSCYGSKLVETPSLDRIANEGMRFNNCYVTNAICAPSRAVILTGKFSHVNGVKDNADVFDGNQMTYPKLLKRNGYQTAMIGKWHLGSTPRGFDYYSVLPGQGDYYQPEFIENGAKVKEQGYVTDIITDKAINWLDERDKSKPFAMIYQHKAPHRNWLAAPRHMGMYEDHIFPEPETLMDNYDQRGAAAHEQEMEIKNHMWDAWDFKIATREELEEFGRTHDLKTIKDAKQHDVDGANKRNQDLEKLYRVYSRLTPDQKDVWEKAYAKRIKQFRNTQWDSISLLKYKYQLYMRDYLSTLASLDENVGRMLDYLEEKGELDNTIVVYTSDQGFFLGEHGWFDKRMMYEQCYRMPLLIRYPKAIKPHSVSNALTMNVDFAPTFLDYAGIVVPEEMQGKSMRPVFEQQKGVESGFRDATFYHYYEYPSWHSVKRHYGIRTQRYKLIHFYNDVNQWELYDLEKDPNELKSVYDSKEYKEVVMNLKRILKEKKEQYNDPGAENEVFNRDEIRH